MATTTKLKESPFLKNVNEESWFTFSLSYSNYWKKGGIKRIYDMLSQEALSYYQFQVAEDILQMNDDILFRTINTLNQPNMEPLEILICGISMEESKSYNKSVIRQYISSFITILASYPIIQAECMPQAIIKQFYKNCNQIVWR